MSYRRRQATLAKAIAGAKGGIKTPDRYRTWQEQDGSWSLRDSYDGYRPVAKDMTEAQAKVEQRIWESTR